MAKRLLIIGILCALLWGLVTWMSYGLPDSLCQMLDQWTGFRLSPVIDELHHGFYYDTNNNDMPTIIFLGLFGIIFILTFTLIRPLEKQKEGGRYDLPLIIGFAILYRVILLPCVLIHENDIYRYLWDGKSALHGINPYKYAPADLFMVEHNFQKDYTDELNDVTIKARNFNTADYERLNTLIQLRDENPVYYNRIGHWQVPTIYPPTTQAIFLLSSALKTDSILMMKFIFMLFDLGVLWIIIALLRHFKHNPCFSVIYAWSPLVLLELTADAHYDSIPIFFTMLALYLIIKNKKTVGVMTLVLATLSKFFSGVLLAILHRQGRLKHALYFGLCCGLAYLPYFIWNQTSPQEIFAGLLAYNAQWSYNASIFAVIHLILKEFVPTLGATLIPAKLIAGGLYGIALLILMIKRPRGPLDLLHHSFWAIALLFIINPVADPWYYCWCLPFLCFFRYRSWLLLSGLLVISYLNFHSDISWIEYTFIKLPIISWITYLPFFTVLLFEQFKKITTKEALHET